MDLGEAGVGEERAALVGPPDRSGIAALCIGRKVEGIAIAAGRQHHRIANMRFDLARDHIARHNTFGMAIGNDQVEHFGAWVHCDLAGVDLPAERLVGPQQQLLAGLPTGVKGA